MKKGDWSQTYSGKAFWVHSPRVEDVDIMDIAHQLGKICRYNGATKRFYSVAEHSIVGSYYVPKGLELKFLLHDAAETYKGDIIRPIKTSRDKTIEQRIMVKIAEAFNLNYTNEDNRIIKRIDLAIMADEKKHLMEKAPHKWHLPEPPLGITSFPCWGPNEAPGKFLDRFFELYKK